MRRKNKLSEKGSLPPMKQFISGATIILVATLILTACGGRNYELNMDWKYIDALNQIYNEYFFMYDKSPILIINTNDIDFVNDEKDLNEILDIIQKPVKGTKYYNPQKSINIK